MSRIVSVAQLKGGVGKSTLAANVASALAAGGKSVTLVDADAQGTATAWFSQGKLPVTGLTLPLEGDSNVKAWLRDVQAIQTDFVVVDLPPHLGAATEAALVISDVAIVPVEPSGPSLLATGKTVDLIRAARLARGDSYPKAVLVPSRVDRRTATGREIEGILHEFGEPVGPAICQRSAHADAFNFGVWIGDQAKGSAAHHEIEALANIIKRVPAHG